MTPTPATLDALVAGLVEASSLKSLERAGWVRVGVAPPVETVGSHSWGVAWLVLVLAPPELDRGRALEYAVLHDLPEIRTGDITPADRISKSEKSRREHEAMSGICAALDASALRESWERYEAQSDRESRFVRQLDRLDMALQALAQHESGASGMREFLESADTFIVDDALRPVMDAIRRRFDSTSR